MNLFQGDESCERGSRDFCYSYHTYEEYRIVYGWYDYGTRDNIFLRFQNRDWRAPMSWQIDAEPGGNTLSVQCHAELGKHPNDKLKL